MMPTRDPSPSTWPSEPIDPFAQTGWRGYPACRIAGYEDVHEAGAAHPFTRSETARLQALKSDERRMTLAGSFVLRRQLIGIVADCAASDIVLETLAEGAPVLTKPAGWALSLANKGPLTVVAMDNAAAAIGVDVEIIRTIDWRPMLKMICTEGEGEAFAEAFTDRSDSAAAFLRMWTLKEAVLKTTQRGFRAGPAAVSTPPAILTASGKGTIAAFGEHYEFWTTAFGDAVISLARKQA